MPTTECVFPISKAIYFQLPSYANNLFAIFSTAYKLVSYTKLLKKNSVSQLKPINQ